VLSPQSLRGGFKCCDGLVGGRLRVDLLALLGCVMHKATDERLIDIGVAQPPTIGVTVAMGCRAQCLADRKTDTFTGGGMRLVVLVERVHPAHWLSTEVDKGKRVATVDTRDLLQVTVPELQEPLAIFWQEPVRLLVVGRVMRTAFPAGMAPVHQLIARHKAELLGKVFRPVALA